MESFSESFFEGFWHVINWPNYEFVLLLIAVSVVATFKDWKKLASITLVLSLGFALGFTLHQLDFFEFNAAVFHFIIAGLIMFFAIFNFTAKGKTLTSNLRIYGAALFGISAGLVFKIPLLTQLFGDNVWASFPGFVLGLEVALLAGTFAILMLSWLVAEAFGVARRDWQLGFSGAVLGTAVIKLLESLF